MPTSPVVGTDQQPPIYDPTGRWCWWSIHEIFTGTLGLNKYIPKVGDYVVDPDIFQTFIVDALDPVTYIPTLVEKRPYGMSYSFSESDVLFGVGPGTQADTYRVYLDTSVLPHSLAVDARLRVAGTQVTYCKIFRGATLDDTGEVISKMYDSNGQFISENIPLEVVAIDSHNNYAIKVVPPCKCTIEMPDAEVVTAVFYGANNKVVSKRQLLVENTSFIRSLNASQKYVSSISLKSPFMSPTIDNQIDYPLNIPINALNLIGVVHYSDGTSMELPVDGTKFRMFGLEQYVSTIIGQKLNLVLSYGLAPGETAYAGVATDGHYVTEPYTLVTVNPNSSYAVKLFGYPFWVDEITGYQMRWWLLNLDRNVWFEVSDKVIFNAQMGPFNPKGYGYLQKKSVSVNLKQVSGSFKNFVHVQLVDIVLQIPPDGINYPWQVSLESDATTPMYGIGLFAKLKTPSSINLSCGISTYDEWKQRVYLNTFPLVNVATETAPMTPTHFVVNYGGIETTFDISNWNADINVGSNIETMRTVSIRFIKQVGSSEMQLAVAAMIIYP